MSFVMTYFVTSVVILMIHETMIAPVNGQSTVQGCDNGDHLISIVAEIQQLRVELFDKLNQQVQSIKEINASIHKMKGQHEICNESFQEIKSQYGVIVTSLQVVDRRLKEHDISIRNQTQNCLEKHDIFIRNHTQNCLEKHDIFIRNQTQNSRTFANGSCGPAADVCDCSDLKARGHTRSGVYEVCVGRQLNRTCTSAFCDMETANRASLVFQRRQDGSVIFNRTWAEYRDGFGNPDGEFWLGNEMLYLLTSKRKYKLRVDLEDWEGEKRFAEYSTFSINSSADYYRLRVGGYSGDAGDSMDYNNGKRFSSRDVDNDDREGYNCAQNGAWWYGQCSIAFLNGKYYKRNDTVLYATGIHWYTWRNNNNNYDSLKTTAMKLIQVV